MQSTVSAATGQTARTCGAIELSMIARLLDVRANRKFVIGYWGSGHYVPQEPGSEIKLMAKHKTLDELPETPAHIVCRHAASQRSCDACLALDDENEALRRRVAELEGFINQIRVAEHSLGCTELSCGAANTFKFVDALDDSMCIDPWPCLPKSEETE